MLAEEDQEKFNTAMRLERRRKGFYIESTVAQRQYNNLKKYIQYLDKGEFYTPSGKAYKLTSTIGAHTERLYEIMASTSGFEELVEDD